MDAAPDKPIAAWLRETRLRQRMDDGQSGAKPWTVDHFLDLMRAEVGWAPARPNYSKYERGRATPRPPTLARFVRFWTARNEPGPDMSEPVAPEDPMVAAVDRQTLAIREQTVMLRAVLRALGGLPDGGGGGVDLADAAASGIEEGLRRAQRPRELPGPERPGQSRPRLPRDIEAIHA